jgi:alpha-mannosidase
MTTHFMKPEQAPPRMQTAAMFITRKRLLTVFLVALTSIVAHAQVLWQIGVPDRNDAEFALAPNGYGQFDDDAVYVVGKSAPKQDWPYVQPGPEDGWAGGRPHTFTVLFGVSQPQTVGSCKLVIDLLDTQGKAPPRLEVRINGNALERPLPAGAGDDSINGNPARGQPYRLEVEFPAQWLQPGNNKLTVTTVSGSWLLYDCLTLEAPSTATLAPVTGLEAVQIDPGERQIIVVFKTHFDIGYTDLVTNILTRYRTRFADGALAVMEESRSWPPEQQFTWTVPGWPLQQMLWPGQTPERRTKLLQALQEGRLALHALPFTLQTETLDLEDLVQGLSFSANLARANHLPLPRAAKTTDVPQHTWVMPTLLKHAGINFLQIGCNDASKPMQVPLLFWWEGPDGSRLLTSYSPQYGTKLLPPRNWPYRTWLAMIMTGDNHGPPTAAEVAQLRKQAAERMPGAKLKFGRLEDFYEAIVAEKNEHIPVVRGDMPDTWIHGFESMPIETKTGCDFRPLENALAILDTELRAAGIDTPPVKPALAEAFENSLLYSEHTFGYYGSQPGGFWYGQEWKQKLAEGKYTRLLQSFDDKRAYIHKMAAIVTNGLAARLQLLASNLGATGPRIVVFNPLPWERGGEVEVQLPSADYSGVREAPRGKWASSAISGGTLHFFAEKVPAGGYKTYQLVAGRPPAAALPSQTGEIENQYFRLRVDPVRGGVVSLIDRKSRRELVASQDAACFGSYLHERFAKSNVDAYVASYCRGWGLSPQSDFNKPVPEALQRPYAAIQLTNWTLTLQATARAKTLILRSADAAPLARQVTLKYTLPEGQPYLDIEWSVDNKTPDPIPEGGWLCLPFNLEQPQFVLSRLGSLIDPARDIVDGGNRDLLYLNSGMTVIGADGFGVGLCPLDSPVVSLGEPGLWKFSMKPSPRRARVFINLYNNQWDTNFPLWQEGSWNSRVRLWVVRSGSNTQALITPSWEARVPLLAQYSSGSRGSLPVRQKGLSLSRRGVLVTLFGPDPYSDETLLRVWEQAGTSGRLTVNLPSDFVAARAVPVNLRGEPAGAPLLIRNHSFKFDLGAFAPASFRLE